MRYRTLGRTGLQVSVIGLGGGGIGQVWGPTTDDECVRVVRQAVDRGVTMIDVAPSYGRGKAEEMVGRAGPEVRRQVTLATKVRVGPDERAAIGPTLRASLEASLRRLNTDAVDLLQLHNRIRQERQPADPGSLGIDQVLGPGGALETMQALQREGKTRFLGITGYGDYDGVAAVIESGAFDTVQAHLSLLNQASVGRRPSARPAGPFPRTSFCWRRRTAWA
jgi:L-galactose dehydrogenase/L-glyceraldehyde 3-phosphate reductase